jgi:hypothetical protein
MQQSLRIDKYLIYKSWVNEPSFDVWWTKTALERGKERKAMTLMIMHISLDIWKERGARVFRHQYSSSGRLKMRQELRAWLVQSS